MFKCKERKVGDFDAPQYPTAKIDLEIKVLGDILLLFRKCILNFLHLN